MPSLWDEMTFMTNRLKGRILDVGCGNGEYTKRLRRNPGVTEVIGFDLASPDKEVWGTTFNRNAGGPYVQDDMAKMKFNAEVFDGILAWQSLEHTDEPDIALWQFQRVLKPGGLLCLAIPVGSKDTFARKNEPRGDAHLTFWDPDEVKEHADSAGFMVADGPYFDQTGCQNWLFIRLRQGYPAF